MASNITNPVFLASSVTSAYSYPAGANTVVPYKVSLRTGVKATSGTLASGVIPDGVTINAAGPSNGQFFTLAKREIVIVTVEPSAVVAYNAPISVANTGTGNVRTGVAGTDYIIGKALDTSDGAGTTNVPHYIRVDLSL